MDVPPKSSCVAGSVQNDRVLGSSEVEAVTADVGGVLLVVVVLDVFEGLRVLGEVGHGFTVVVLVKVVEVVVDVEVEEVGGGRADSEQLSSPSRCSTHWHCSPLRPAGHEQENSSTPSMHVPPLRHLHNKTPSSSRSQRLPGSLSPPARCGASPYPGPRRHSSYCCWQRSPW